MTSQVVSQTNFNHSKFQFRTLDKRVSTMQKKGVKKSGIRRGKILKKQGRKIMLYYKGGTTGRFARFIKTKMNLCVMKTNRNKLVEKNAFNK